VTPRAVIRGPLGGNPENAQPSVALTQAEEARVEGVFLKHDSLKKGEIDVSNFYPMCEEMELPLDYSIAQEWLQGRSQAKGLAMEDFKQLYGRILSAQGPAVRAVASGKALRLTDVARTETEMRAAFEKSAAGGHGQVSFLALPKILRRMNFPDHHGDGFDRFVTEWADLEGIQGIQGTVNFHQFVNCVNLLVDFCEQHQVALHQQK